MKYLYAIWLVFFFLAEYIFLKFEWKIIFVFCKTLVLIFVNFFFFLFQDNGILVNGNGNLNNNPSINGNGVVKANQLTLTSDAPSIILKSSDRDHHKVKHYATINSDINTGNRQKLSKDNIQDQQHNVGTSDVKIDGTDVISGECFDFFYFLWLFFFFESTIQCWYIRVIFTFDKWIFQGFKCIYIFKVKLSFKYILHV